ncbi:hemin ABC transporter substrate-binding protein [Diaminobutyricimonas sp. LJ205]|uniref:heme/hemin ABC transporter substrate-binding protein n=1 Tax=Diaminobutyricimonas sp. LJ205 TaxID=2683590 RepID=UPI0012F4910E|nr:ABC transporter substrate-binding protein [Diaminobutyricimonas sp. LJ205]
MRKRPAFAVAAATVALAALTACTGAQGTTPDPAPTAVSTAPLADLDILDDPRSFEGPSTALLQQDDIEPITESPQQQLPTTVTSHDRSGDQPVSVTSTDRVLGLDIAGSIAATIAGLGFADSLVGRDVSTTFPAAEDLPVVTSSGHSINAEAVLSLRPTLVITDGTIGPIDVVLQLRDAGIPVVFVDREPSIAGVGELARQVGAAFGAAHTGELLAAHLLERTEQKIAEIAEIAPTDPDDQVRVLFLYLRGSAGIYYLFGAESGADVLINSLGARDIAGENGWDGMKPMTDEALIAANPDLILVMSSGLESAGGIDALLAEKPAIGLTAAGERRRFVDMDDGDILSFGPRLPDVLDALARAIYAPGQ